MQPTQPSRRLIDRISAPLVRLMNLYYPDLFLFIIIITVVSVLLVTVITPMQPIDIIHTWGNSLSNILAFTTQIALTLIISHALVHTAFFDRLLNSMGSIARTPIQAYCIVVFIPGLFSLISWPLGLISGGIIAHNVGRSTIQQGLKVHYPLLVASAFAANIIWHMGYSATAPLSVATEGHSMTELIGGILPITETVFTTWNMALAFILLILVFLFACYLRPSEADTMVFNSQPLSENLNSTSEQKVNQRPIDKWEESKWFTWSLATIMLLYIVKWFSVNGFNLNLNIVNWTFLTLLLFLCDSPRHFMNLIQKAAAAAGPMIIAYPFYAGIIGILMDSGLAAMLSNWFADIASTESLPLWTFISAALVNMFIPSGGAQWIVQGPIFLTAANKLNVDPELIVMAVAYGDQVTNIIQPLPAIPLLILAGLKLKHIMGYMLLFCLLGIVVLGTGLAIMSYL